MTIRNPLLGIDPNSRIFAVPPSGAVWLCGACGRIGRGRKMDIGDESCFLNCCLVYEDSIERNDAGMIIAAKALPKEEQP